MFMQQKVNKNNVPYKGLYLGRYVIGPDGYYSDFLYCHNGNVVLL